MFIYSVWDKICKNIAQNNIIKIEEILENVDSSNWIAIKHDVETNVLKALDLARIEAKYNIKATYYVQADLLDANYKLLQEIQKLGHTITYHYDVLDANAGDINRAIKEFNSNLLKFEKYGFEVKTVCPHGNPVMIRDGWNSNKDFFRDQNVKKLYPEILDMVIELPNKLEYLYISDAGYSFKKIANIKDNDISNKGDIEIKDYKELVDILNKNRYVILSTHPHRWEKNALNFMMRIYLFKLLRVIAKTVSKVPILKNIISKYYYLAKKI
jgi:hypothetical protein